MSFRYGKFYEHKRFGFVAIATDTNLVVVKIGTNPRVHKPGTAYRTIGPGIPETRVTEYIEVEPVDTLRFVPVGPAPGVFDEGDIVRFVDHLDNGDQYRVRTIGGKQYVVRISDQHVCPIINNEAFVKVD